MNDKELDIVLKHIDLNAGEAARYKDLFKQMCHYYCSLIEGDDLYVEDAYKLMHEHGITDEDGFEIDQDDE